jgi:hypothetical protein
MELPPQVLLAEGKLHVDVFGTTAVDPAALIAQQVAMAAFEAATKVFGGSAARSAQMAEKLQSLKVEAGAQHNTSAEFDRPSQSERQQLASARNVPECVQVLLACSEAQQLPELLQSVGQRLCAAVPVPSCCNYFLCTNMSCNTELQQVQGRAAKCSACGSARCEHQAHDVTILSISAPRWKCACCTN